MHSVQAPSKEQAMIDVMKLAMERRARALSDIEKLKDEVARLNQFIRVGEGLIARAGTPARRRPKPRPRMPPSTATARPMPCRTAPSDATKRERPAD